MARTIWHTLVTCAVALLLSSLVTARAAATNSDRPNIVIVLVDDMGVMDTSVPFLTDQSGKPKRYPLNDFYRTPNEIRRGVQQVA